MEVLWDTIGGTLIAPRVFSDEEAKTLSLAIPLWLSSVEIDLGPDPLEAIKDYDGIAYAEDTLALIQNGTRIFMTKPDLFLARSSLGFFTRLFNNMAADHATGLMADRLELTSDELVDHVINCVRMLDQIPPLAVIT